MYKESFDKVGDTKKRPTKGKKKSDLTKTLEDISDLRGTLHRIKSEINSDSSAIAISNLIVAGEIKAFRLRLDE